MGPDYYNDLLKPAGLAIIYLGSAYFFLKFLKQDAEDFVRDTIRFFVGELQAVAAMKWNPKSVNALGTILAFVLVLALAGFISLPLFGSAEDAAAMQSVQMLIYAGITVVFFYLFAVIACVALLSRFGR